MTFDESSEPALSEDDRQALIRHRADLRDLPDAVLEEARQREENAYVTARRIAEGTLDPLSA